jgi:hypothetical protein
VALYWRAAPDKVAVPERLRRQLARGSRKRDLVLLRNGDALEGVLNQLDARHVEVEVDRKRVTAGASQLAAVALSTDLADKARPKGAHARLVLLEGERSPGGRLTLSSAASDGETLRGKALGGVEVSVPLGRVAALDVYGGRAVYLSDLKPAKYEFFPYLDARWPWEPDGTALGCDLRLGGSTYDKGLGLHAHARLAYRLGGAYQRFEALVGLDERDGRKGRARVRVLGDGKPLGEPAERSITCAGGPVALSLDVRDVQELTLEVAAGEAGPVQAVVNWADARLVK